MTSDQPRLDGGVGDSTEHKYEVDRVRELVETDFESYEELTSATEGVLKMLSTDVVRTTPVTTTGYEQYAIVDVRAIKEERKVRPINTELFIQDVDKFRQKSVRFSKLMGELSDHGGVSDVIEQEHTEFIEANGINEILYTMAQGVGIGLDALSSSKNKARKHAGLRFESVIEQIMSELDIANTNHLFNIPIDDTDDTYRCEIDMIIGPDDDIATTPSSLDKDELVVSIKTTSKDRMTKVFTDKMLMSKFLGQEIPLIALFLHDIQRKGQDKINTTFVSNNYYIYYEYLTPIEGTYFIDPPKKIDEVGYSDKLSTYKELILNDIWELTEQEQE